MLQIPREMAGGNEPASIHRRNDYEESPDDAAHDNDSHSGLAAAGFVDGASCRTEFRLDVGGTDRPEPGHAFLVFLAEILALF